MCVCMANVAIWLCAVLNHVDPTDLETMEYDTANILYNHRRLSSLANATETNTTDTTDTELGTDAIVGIAIGGALLLIVTVSVSWWWYSQRAVRYSAGYAPAFNPAPQIALGSSSSGIFANMELSAIVAAGEEPVSGESVGLPLLRLERN